MKDAELAARMRLMMLVFSIGVSHESQLRAAQLLTSLLAGYEKLGATVPAAPQNGAKDAPGFAKQQLCLSYAAALMEGRWIAIKEAFGRAGSGARLSLMKLEEPQMCNFFETERHPAPGLNRHIWPKST